MSKRNRRDVLTTLLKPPVATHRVPQFHRLPTVSYKTNNFALGLIEDRRTHYPGLTPFKRPIVQAAVGAPARLHLMQKPQHKAPSQTKARIAFAQPAKLPICIRRRIRKEVIHAIGAAGSKNLRKPHRNEWSEISCQS